MPSIREAMIKKILNPYIPKRKNASTGSVAPATGKPQKELYMSRIVLELINTANVPELMNLVRLMGLSDEFTLFAVFIMRHWPNGQMEILELAKRVRSWGRVHCVYYLEPANDEIIDWLLYNGIDNDVMPEYSALEVFEKVGVSDLLDKRPDDRQFKAILNIIDHMLEEGPVEGISGVEDPQGLLAKVLKTAEGRALDQESSEILGRVSDVKNSFEGK